MSTPKKDATVTLPNAPYRGIQSFRFIDQQIFAARAEEVWTLLSNIKLYRAVLLYGDSGTGKSSLINAGLIPRALLEGYIPNRLRIQPFAGREIKVERLRASAEGEAPAFLPSNFTGLESDGLPDEGTAENFELSLAKFRERLKEFRRSAKGAPGGATADATGTTGRPLLIFDQFEEFITLFEEAQSGGPTDEATRLQRQGPKVQRQIFVTLIKLIRDETLPIKILFSFREDYLAKLSPLVDHCPQLLNQALRLLPPKVEVLAEIIRAPFTNPKLREHFLQGENHSELTEALAKKIAAELGRHGARDTVNLTELQIVCLRLWQSAKPEELFKSEGIRGLLKSYGSDVFRLFKPELRDAAVGLLALMITASNTRNIIAEEDLLSRANVGGKFQPEELRLALVALADTQIVRRELRRHLYFYEITSEYLVPWIKEQVAERKAAEERRLAEDQQLQAEANLLVQRQRTRMLTRLLALMIILLCVVIGLGLYARRQTKRAELAESNLAEQKREAERMLNSLKGTLVTNATSQDPNAAQAASDLLAQAVQTDQSLAQQLPPRFYIHVSDDSQRPQAARLAESLRNKGYIVPGIANVGSKAPKDNELRYFRKNDTDMPTSKDLVALLNATTGLQWVDILPSGFENATTIRPGHFEIWFGALPGSPFGWLKVKGVVDEQEKPLRERAILAVRSTTGELIQQKRGAYLVLDVGDYTLTASMKGYEPVTQNISIQSGLDTWVWLKFTRTKRSRD